MDWATIIKDLPAWILALIAVALVIDKMGLLHRRERRTDAVEGPMFDAMGASATTVHNELKRSAEIIERQGNEIDELREANGEYRRENLMLVGKIERSDASRKRLLAMLDAVNREQNDLIAANQLENKLLDGITQIRSDFEDTRLKP